MKKLHINFKKFLEYKIIFAEYLETILFESASLSFYTIFAIIPLALLMFSLFTNSPFFEDLFQQVQNFIYSTMIPGKSDIVAKYINSLLQNSTKIGIMGFIYGFIAAVLFFFNFEQLFYKIFKVKKKRDLWEKISTFWTLAGLSPIFLFLSFYLSLKIKDFINILKLLPFLMIWFIFFLIFIITPNKKVSRRAAAISSFIAAVLWNIVKFLFIHTVMANKIYTTIYGSLSMLIYLFLWIYISWIILISCAYLCAYLHEKFRNENS